MKKQKVIALFAAVSIFALLVSACGKKANNEDNVNTTPPQQEESTAPQKPDSEAPQKPDSGEKTGLSDLASMLGKTDEEAKDLYNGGTENKSEDGKTVLGRTYQTKLDGQEAGLETVYTDKGKVGSVAVTFKSLSPEQVKELVTKAFGEPKATDDSQELDTKYLTWNQGSAVITMNESFGMATVNFTLAA